MTQVTIDLELDAGQLAATFLGLDPIEQAQFFLEIFYQCGEQEWRHETAGIIKHIAPEGSIVICDLAAAAQERLGPMDDWGE